MTWQRIDENSYIDDTLVTCAEYQLFIDEMREQGKYYQPDHWTSLRFPKGQGMQPILGIRHSDAVTFCKWLIKQGSGGWLFRLPSQEEAARLQIKYIKDVKLGYWILGPSRFVWIDHNHLDIRCLNHAGSLENVILDALTKGFSNDYRRHYDDKYNLANAFSLARKYAENDGLNRARKDALELDLERHAYDVNSYDYFCLRRDRTRDPSFYSDLARALYAALTYQEDYDFVIDIFTLQERIAGRSPAFEGIRLVKERIR